MVVRMCSFVRVHLYMSAQNGDWTINAEAFSDLMRSIAGTTENIGGIAFGRITAFLLSVLQIELHSESPLRAGSRGLGDLGMPVFC